MKIPCTTLSKKRLIVSLLTLMIISVFLRTAETSAHLAQPEDTQPNFVGVAQTSPDGSATIISQETRLDSAYFAETGNLTGIEVTPGGLNLAAGEAEGHYTSGVIQSPLGFTTDIVPLWAVDLPEGTSLRLETRLSANGGESWSEWLENPEAFYPVRDNLHSGNLIWASGDQIALQFRVVLTSNAAGVSPVLRAVTLVFNDTSQGPTDAEIAGQMARISGTDSVCPVQKPAVVSRTEWGCPDGQHSPRRPPTYAPVTHIIIHQTETPNNTHPYQDWAGWVRSVWNYHANVLWWGDVGYNYLIDPNGTIYEGRAGGDDVVGIHDTHNAGSMAIGFIGCYGDCDDPRLSSAEPTQAMLDSAIHLMAWKLQQAEIDPLSQAPYDGLNDVPVIAGGRDVTWTSSPGAKLYDQLPDIRTKVAEKANCSAPPDELPACQITRVVFDRESYTINQTMNVTVSLADHQGTPLIGANVDATVTRRAVETQASTGLGFIDRAGDYDGVYSNTELPGVYDFTFRASDPTGERFAPCTATTSVPVDDPNSAPTPTLTPTATTTAEPPITPTATPTATVEPTGTTLKFTPENLQLPVCNSQGSMTVDLENVADMGAMQLEINYDPAVIQIIDADDTRAGVQVTIDDVFSGGFVAQNTVDTANGRISVATTLLSGNKIDGNTGLITIDWRPLAVGNSSITFGDVILASTDGTRIDFTPRSGTVEVTGCSGISGVLALQGRTNHSGILVTNSAGQQTQSQADGTFVISGGGLLRFEYPGFLSAQADVQTVQGVVSTDGTGFQPTNLGEITLLAGDVNSDNVIDILDLAYIATHFDDADPLADLNADGKVSIVDLALAARNYQQTGPLTAWR